MTSYTNIPPIVKICFGLILYSTCGFLSMYTESVNYVKMLAVVIMLIAFFQSPKNARFDNSGVLLQVFVAYTVFIFLRGTLLFNFPVSAGHEVTNPYGIIRYFLVYEYSALSFLLILCVLIPFDRKEMSYYRLMAYLCTVLCLINVFIFKSDLFSFDTLGKTSIFYGGDYLTIRKLIRICFIGFSVIVLFSYSLVSFKNTWFDYFPLLVIFLYGLAQVAGGGRGGSVTALLYIAFLLYFFLKYSNKRSKGTSDFLGFLIRAFLVIFVIYGIYFFLFKSGNADFLFSRLFEDGVESGELRENNRGVFTNALILDFNNHPLAWIFGKGANGTFMVDGAPRETIEWGFMYLILKGGVIYLILYVAVLLKTFYLGFFKSRNVFCKAMAILCFICAYTLIPFGLPAVSLEYVLVWHYIRLINTGAVRNMTDNEIRLLINQRSL